MVFGFSTLFNTFFHPPSKSMMSRRAFCLFATARRIINSMAFITRATTRHLLFAKFLWQSANRHNMKEPRAHYRFSTHSHINTFANDQPFLSSFSQLIFLWDLLLICLLCSCARVLLLHFTVNFISFRFVFSSHLLLFLHFNFTNLTRERSFYDTITCRHSTNKWNTVNSNKRQKNTCRNVHVASVLQKKWHWCYCCGGNSPDFKALILYLACNCSPAMDLLTKWKSTSIVYSNGPISTLYCALRFVFEISVMLYKNSLLFVNEFFVDKQQQQRATTIQNMIILGIIYAKCNKHTSIAPFNVCMFVAVVVFLRLCVQIVFSLLSFSREIQSHLYQEHKIDFRTKWAFGLDFI